MMRFLTWTAFTAALFLAAACMQDPAEVSYKGDEFFGRVHEGALDSPNHETFPEDSPRIKPGYSQAVEPARVQSVGVTDLAPPTQQAAPANNADEGKKPFGTPSKPLSQGDATESQHAAKAQTGSKFIWPVSDGKIISHFGPKAGGRSNDGVNIALAEGEPIYATAKGMVVYAGSDLKGYGNMIILRHDAGWMSAYAHARSIAVKKNDGVKQGDIIAYVGTSGGVTTAQVHFAIRHGRTPVDPELYLPKGVISQ